VKAKDAKLGSKAIDRFAMAAELPKHL